MPEPEPLDRLRELVGANSSDDAALTEDLEAATELVDRYLAEHGDDNDPPPQSILERAVRQVAADLFNRRSAQNGVIVQQFATGDGGTATTPVRIARDPIVSARDLLSPWVTEVSFA